MLEMDQYNCVITTDENAKDIAIAVRHLPVVFTWEDASDCYTLLLTYHPGKPNGCIMTRGLKNTDLFVSVVGLGCFGFKIDGTSSSENYYSEKLGFKVPIDLFILLEGIRHWLYRLETGGNNE